MRKKFMASERIILASIVIIFVALLISADWGNTKPPDKEPPHFPDRQLLVSVPEYKLDHVHDLHENPMAHHARTVSGIGPITSKEGDVLFERLSLVSEFVGRNEVGDFYSLELTIGEADATTETTPLLVTEGQEEKILFSAERYQITLRPSDLAEKQGQ